jgi:hypothetical protein
MLETEQISLFYVLLSIQFLKSKFKQQPGLVSKSQAKHVSMSQKPANLCSGCCID